MIVDNRPRTCLLVLCSAISSLLISPLYLVPSGVHRTRQETIYGGHGVFVDGMQDHYFLHKVKPCLSNYCNSLAFESLPLGLDLEDTSDVYFQTYTRTCSFMFYFSSIFMCFPCWCLQPSTFGFGELVDHWFPALGRHDLSASLPFMLAPQYSAWSSDPPCFTHHHNAPRHRH